MPRSIDLKTAMRELSLKRGLFHSEADFQHELAWILREQNPGIEIRLEHPRHDRAGAIDLVARRSGRPVLALELKYLCRRLETVHQAETYSLKAQSAYPLRRYDVVKDLEAVERYAAAHPGAQAAIIVLTNDRSYWQAGRDADTSDRAFRFHEGRVLAGALEWGAQTSLALRAKRDTAVTLTHSHLAKWMDYSVVDPEAPGGRFRFLCLEISPALPGRPVDQIELTARESEGGGAEA